MTIIQHLRNVIERSISRNQGSDDDSDSFYAYVDQFVVGFHTEEDDFIQRLRDIKNNDPDTILLSGKGDYVQNITNEQWEEIGRDISNNSFLRVVYFCERALNDDKMSFLFRGLMGSSSIRSLSLRDNGLSEVRSMSQFLQNAKTLEELILNGNNIQSEGFKFLLQELRGGPIKELFCIRCGIESIQIDTNHLPKLTQLRLTDNSINADGCREIAKMLQGGDSVLTHLFLDNNNIDDEGVAILVDVLHSNTSMKVVQLGGNDDITNQGRLMMLKLVNDISSVKDTLESNHTLKTIGVIKVKAPNHSHPEEDEEIQWQIDMATQINGNHVGNPEAAGREKVIQTQLHSVQRADLAELQGVSQSAYRDINPLHLPEVLSLVGSTHGLGELFIAFKSSIEGVISTVNRKECIKQRMAYHRAQLEVLGSELAAIELKERDVDGIGDRSVVANNLELDEY